MEMMNKKNRQFSDEWALHWDGFAGTSNSTRGAEEFARQGTKHRPSRVLDIGCGTGVLVPYLRKQCPDASFVEMDFSMEMLAVNRGLHGDSATEYCCDAIESAPFMSESFDAILCFKALPHIEVERTLLRCAELLKPRGRIAIGYLMNGNDLNTFHSPLSESAARDHLPAAKELSKMLSNAGLTVLQCEQRPDWCFVLAEKSQGSLQSRPWRTDRGLRQVLFYPAGVGRARRNDSSKEGLHK
jgi:2-polyprenyl-3-methyl-5-hydroxy-6-metoxy-1,4-benzoquinol methylase